MQFHETAGFALRALFFCAMFVRAWPLLQTGTFRMRKIELVFDVRVLAHVTFSHRVCFWTAMLRRASRNSRAPQASPKKERA